jgi:hypothetical protein
VTIQEIGVTLVIVGFCAWTIAWVGLISYGLVWLPRDRRGATISLGAGSVILASGLTILTQAPGGLQ